MYTPDIVVIHGVCNNISPRQNQEKLTEEEIAKEIISDCMFLSCHVRVSE